MLAIGNMFKKRSRFLVHPQQTVPEHPYYVLHCVACEYGFYAPSSQYPFELTNGYHSHKCTECGQRLQLMLTCGEWSCLQLTDVHSTACSKCSHKLRPAVSMEDVMLCLGDWDIGVLLGGCNNFHTNRENLLYLVQGYIHQKIRGRTNSEKSAENIRDSVYEIIPDDIVQACIGFGYDLNRFDIRDKWYSSALQANCVIFGRFSVTTKTIRKLWRVQVRRKEDIDSPLTLDIGIGADDDECEDKLCIRNGEVQGSNVAFESEDIVSILYLKRTHAVLRFAINGKECHSATKLSNYITGWLWAKTYHELELRVLNDTFTEQHID